MKTRKKPTQRKPLTKAGRKPSAKTLQEVRKPPTQPHRKPPAKTFQEVLNDYGVKYLRVGWFPMRIWVEATSHNSQLTFLALLQFGLPLADARGCDMTRPEAVFEFGVGINRVCVTTSIDSDLTFAEAWAMRGDGVLNDWDVKWDRQLEWVKTTLSNDEVSTDDELHRHFTSEGVPHAKSREMIARRTEFLKGMIEEAEESFGKVRKLGYQPEGETEHAGFSAAYRLLHADGHKLHIQTGIGNWTHTHVTGTRVSGVGRESLSKHLNDLHKK